MQVQGPRFAVAAHRAGEGARREPPIITPGLPTDDSGDKKPAVEDRSTTAMVLTGAGVGLNVANRALSVSRLLAARKIAFQSDKQLMWASQVLLMKSTNDIVPNTGGEINLFSKFRLHNTWGHAFRLSQGMKTISAPLTLALAVPNLYGAVSDGGPNGLYDSREGRTGVSAAVASAVQLAYFKKAAALTTDAHGPIDFTRKMLSQKILGSWNVVGWSVAAYGVIIANELGAFDMFNSDNKRATTTVLADAAKQIPNVLRHPTELM